MKKKYIFILCTILIIGIILVTSIIIIPQIKYNKATELLNSSNYSASIEIFESISNYKDSQQLIEKAKALQADELISAGKYDEAYIILKSIGDKNVANANIYNIATKLYEENNIEGAYSLFFHIKDYKDSSQKLQEIVFNKEKDALQSASIGDIIKFGTYEQDNNTKNGSESIEWIVLDNKNDQLFVLSKYCLDSDYFDDTYVYAGDDIIDLSGSSLFFTIEASSSWKLCSLNYNLNNNFYKNAFNEREKELIIPTLYHTTDSWDESFETYNKITLLSSTEARQHLKTSNNLKAKPTVKAIANGLNEVNGYSEWWLRDTGGLTVLTSYVDTDGILDSYGKEVNTKSGIRPAMWIRIPQ